MKYIVNLTRYSSACLARVMHPVNLMFPDPSGFSEAALQKQLEPDFFPTNSDVRQYVQILLSELDLVASGAPFVVLGAVKTVRSSVSAFISRLEVLAGVVGFRDYAYVEELSENKEEVRYLSKCSF